PHSRAGRDDRHDLGLAAGELEYLRTARRDEERRPRLLDRLWPALRLHRAVIRSLESHLVLGEDALHERHRLGQTGDADPAAVERDAGALVVAVEPSGAEADLDATIRNDVEGREFARENDRVAEIVVE